MAGAPRDRALYHLATANNHGDLAIKLSSLRQVRDILLSIDSSLAAELFPYLIELQSSPESLVRKMLIEVIEDVGLKAVEHSSLLMSVILALLKDRDPFVAKQSIISGTNFFYSVLKEMALQFQHQGKVERWLEELWRWTVKFKDAVFGIALEPGFVGKRLLALKLMETYVLLFTSDTNDPEKPVSEGSRQAFNISWLVGGHPVLDPVMLMSEVHRLITILLNLLRSAGSNPGAFTIMVVSCLAAIARKRPVHYSTILTALLDFGPSFEIMRGCHAASIQYSLRTAFLGFLRCTQPAIMESRDRLLRALRAMNAGDAADQVIRQVDKMIKSMDRASRDAWSGKDEQLSTQLPLLVDPSRKRSMPYDNNEEPANSQEIAPKHMRFTPNTTSPVQINDFMHNSISVNGVPSDIPTLDGVLTPVEQMVTMIGALLAEGERGAESLEILISEIHPDMLADIVITNMKHLPKAPPPLTRLGDLPANRQISGSTQVLASSGPTDSVHSPVLNSQLPFSLATSASLSSFDTTVANNLPADSKRDPRRDPRRLDPRRGVASIPVVEETGSVQSEVHGSISSGKPASISMAVENPSPALMLKTRVEEKTVESRLVSGSHQQTSKVEVLDGFEETGPVVEVNASSDPILYSAQEVDEDLVTVNISDDLVTKGDDTSSLAESDQHSPSVSNTRTSEETLQDLPQLPPYVELNPDQQRVVEKLAIERILGSYKDLYGIDCQQMRLALLARLVAQVDADDDVVGMLQKHVIVDYQQQKGHELVLHVLYHLHSLMISESVESSSFALAVYEKFLLTVAKSLLDAFPASDKSFSRLLGEVPVLPDSTYKLLNDLCYPDVTHNPGKEICDVERVTQGLGTVWNLIVKRPHNRQACLDIALKCALHSHDEIRATAIRLVANKLYQLSYISENIEQYATNTLLSAVDQNISELENAHSASTEQINEGEVESQETSVSGSQISEIGTSENDSMRSIQPVAPSSSTLSFSEAQRLTSLFFALCIKKPVLLRLVFKAYGRAPRAVKQAVHRHIPILIRALGSSCSELLAVISDPPQGSEHLLTLVLQILTQETSPSSDLIATVKHLYETKLKDVTILIPMLSSLSKNEVLPIFPRLVDLPLEKFQRALAYILQGSAHTGPALTPVEVLVAIHSIIPEKDGLALKKIMDVCSACFEQRTVFTQQVLAKALNQMVDQTSLPLLFMRTVIQAIDAFPTLVDFVMEILAKLVNKQVWRLPKLWVGFLKCAFQTQPHSFQVLIQLPPAQLENALNKYTNLRGSLAAYASQPSIKSSLSRATLAVLGLGKEAHMQQPHSLPLHSDTSSTVHGSTLT